MRWLIFFDLMDSVESVQDIAILSTEVRGTQPMTIITHDHYHQAPVEIKAAGISREALKALGAAIEAALIVAKYRSEPPLKAPRPMKADMREVLAALVLMALRDLKVDTLPNITLGKAGQPDCPACGHTAAESWPESAYAPTSEVTGASAAEENPTTT